MARPLLSADPSRRAWSTLGGWICAALLAAGCSPRPDRTSCQPACESTYRCDLESNRCRPKHLSDYAVSRPGRALAATELDGTAFLSSVHPDERLIVAGRADRTESARTLDRIGAEAPLATAIDADDEAGVVAAVWLGADGIFRISRRENGRWRAPRRATTESGYAATADFDVALRPDGSVHILFRDGRDRALQYLARATGDAWRLETIDDGSAVASRSDCSPGGADPARPGPGYEPDAEFLSAGLASALQVSYYEGDCGDLRLAQRAESTWTVRVVDTGTFSIRGDPARRAGNVGRFSALSVQSNGDVAVAYQDARRGLLAFASEANGDFGRTLVDPGVQLDEFSRKRKHLVGAFADLAFDRDGTPYVVYMNGSTARLHFAWRTLVQAGNRRWVHRSIRSDAATGFHAQIVLLEDRAAIYAERLVREGGSYESRILRTTVDLR